MKLNNIKWIFFDMGSTLIDETLAMEHRIREVIEGSDVTYEQFVEKKIFFAKQNKSADLETIKFFGLTKTPWHKEDERLFPDTMKCLKKLHGQYRIGIIANQSCCMYVRKTSLPEHKSMFPHKEGICFYSRVLKMPAAPDEDKYSEPVRIILRERRYPHGIRCAGNK